MRMNSRQEASRCRAVEEADEEKQGKGGERRRDNAATHHLSCLPVLNS
uniref:Uncharacterized protein n=1 Tax=Arundo donax TaxID=35708 RepID=A0A0A9ERA6_ARUDO